jgi:hypothetical protein
MGGILTKGLVRLYSFVRGGAVAQLGERVNRTDEARGSNPLSSMPGVLSPIEEFGAVAQLGERLNGIQ